MIRSMELGGICLLGRCRPAFMLIGIILLYEEGEDVLSVGR